MSPGGSSGSSASSASYSSRVIGSSLMKPQAIASSIRRRRADPNAAAARQRVGSCIDAFGGGGRLTRRSSSGERPRTEFLGTDRHETGFVHPHSEEREERTGVAPASGRARLGLAQTLFLLLSSCRSR